MVALQFLRTAAPSRVPGRWRACLLAGQRTDKHGADADDGEVGAQQQQRAQRSNAGLGGFRGFKGLDSAPTSMEPMPMMAKLAPSSGTAAQRSGAPADFCSVWNSTMATASLSTLSPNTCASDKQCKSLRNDELHTTHNQKVLV